MPRVDHVVYGVRDLDVAAARLADDFGLHAEAGGEHPGFGTANRLVGLGEAYLELLAGPPVEAVLGDGPDRLLGWMVVSDDIEADAARLGIEVL
ncbi:MAG TPA: VOC family protein, partial [Acidimicrobiales bacterium]